MARGNMLRQAANAQTTKPPDAAQIAGITVAAIGLVPLLAVVLVCLVGIIAITGTSTLATDPETGVSFGPELLGEGNGDVAGAIIGGSGKGRLAANAVPRPELVPALESAGQECDLISPIVLAAQIQVESEWDPATVGPDGEQGIAQLPPGVFDEYGEDDDDNGTKSVNDPIDAIHAQARYLCHLGTQVQQLLADHEIGGDALTMTLLAWDIGIDEVKALGTQLVPLDAYPYQVRGQFGTFSTGEDAPSPSPTSTGTTPGGGATPGGGGAPLPGNTGFNQAVFNQMFKNAIPFYTYSAMTTAMAKYPAFASGSGDVAKREIAAFLANVNHESGGLRYVEELNQSLWGDYCNRNVSYGCPAGQRAYHGRGPIQISWNMNYKAAGDSLGVDLLNRPDLVKNDASIAWGTALWFWMTQPGAGKMTPHAAITGGNGFGETIRSINGSKECNGRIPAAINSRVQAYQTFCQMLGVSPGDRLRC
ncbi:MULTISPECIES: glycoside hydrolase family 19 protein [Actinoplanes]|uniref:glycoside hydrolase family 19 protein n=1 Tax=Actinoplanes TaxID=1865 RepID=UPI0005F2936C|nr:MULTISPECIES: glycoside hydrolase family 19 protein [Actinoplanes]GLY02440.1 hypothetical protein Acsp01_28190 [Actinoplanes sp. NBRC 101535]